MPKPEPRDFDFDYWSRLAQEDPATFEEQRSDLLEEFILEAPPDLRRRLRGLQWQVDQARERSGTPLGACLRLSKMMWDSVLGERGLLESMQSLGDSSEQLSEEKQTADILPFKSRETDDH